ncbi:MAG: M50 family metallopeptidase [Rubripirellula sp.]|jgi:hypothetical protein|nr:M50 family metallopeptidase [Rubripirellula sp.]
MTHDHGNRLAVFAVTAIWAWTVMTMAHELGHVLAGIVGGGKLIYLELRPWHLPDSQFVGDPFPWVTLWAGPVLGSLVPLGIAVLIKRPATWFIAWFCLLANGLYLLLGLLSGGPELDTNKLIRAGSSTAALAIIALIATTFGYWKLRGVCRVMSRPEPAPEFGAALRKTPCWIFAGLAWGIANSLLAFARWPIG